MRKFFVFVILVVLAGVGLKDFIRSGECDAVLDRLKPSISAPIEYYWGVLLEMANRDQSALYRFGRVREKYEKTPYAPLAWAEQIEILDDKGDRNGVMEEGKQFLAAYPDHPRAEIIRRKLVVIENGY